jgi:translation initiation factor IF-2
MAKTLVGKVAHYFGNLGVAALSLSGDLKKGDRLRFEKKDGTKVLEAGVTSMQINRQDVDSAGAGDDVAIKVDGKVHDGNLVYRVTED